MKPSDIERMITIAYATRRPVFLWGPPGCGKSSIVKKVAKKVLKIEMIDLRAIHFDPVDLRGLPKIVGDVVKWIVPSFLPTGGFGILFLDELNAAPPMVQAALYQLILDRRLGDYVLPDGWMIVAAGNRETDRAVTQRMSSALANRFAMHLNVDVDFGEWKDWAFENGVDPDIIAFFSWRPELLFTFDPQRNDKAFSTPRSIEFLSDLIKAGLDPRKDFDPMAGCVGNGVATEVMGFYRIKDSLVDLNEAIENPEKVKLPIDNMAACFAFCGALARKATKKNMASIVKIASRLRGDFGVLLIKDAIKVNKGLAETEAYIEWATANQNVLG
jgi:hypothetical protein